MIKKLSLMLFLCSQALSVFSQEKGPQGPLNPFSPLFSISDHMGRLAAVEGKIKLSVESVKGLPGKRTVSVDEACYLSFIETRGEKTFRINIDFRHQGADIYPVLVKDDDRVIKLDLAKSNPEDYSATVFNGSRVTKRTEFFLIYGADAQTLLSTLVDYNKLCKDLEKYRTTRS